MSIWLDIIGIGEDGQDGLSAAALEKLANAEVIVGGDRHHNLIANSSATRIKWPSPFDAMIEEIKSHKGKRIAILVTGDPLWYSVGARILKAIPREEVRFHPQLSAFQWAAARMGWSLADCDTLTVHGRAAEQIIPHFAPKVRLLVLTRDGKTPKEVAQLLQDNGYGESRISVLAALGGPNEKRIDGIASAWQEDVPNFHTLAIECIKDDDAPLMTRVGGLPDDAFENDGQLTKQHIRAMTIAALAPYPDALLWDVGAGCGSIAIEWMRAARGAMAIAAEMNVERCKFIELNAKKLGVPKLQVVEGIAPQCLSDLPKPDAIFIGGGITTDELFEKCWDSLRKGGRLVANSVTLESEAKIIALVEQYGGTLTRVEIQSAEKIGNFKGWKPAMPVTQWVVVK